MVYNSCVDYGSLRYEPHFLVSTDRYFVGPSSFMVHKGVGEIGSNPYVLTSGVTKVAHVDRRSKSSASDSYFFLRSSKY